ncbi:hypothetical protein [Lysinibacillus sp. FSL W7-1291]|uniref:hypothetical protein n=1 Tax=Lysinibacillus sp. FSL W7-1291 TaxID=2954544 RepID=UPI00315B0DBA
MKALLNLLSWLYGIFVVIALSVLVYLIGYTFLVKVNISPEIATILGGLLSLVGGFAGAMGAYMVARHQVNQEKVLKKINLLSAELPIYVGLSLEFKKVVLSLKNFEDNRNNSWKFKLNDEFFEGLKIGFKIIKWDRWIDTKKISDSILLNQILFFEESFKEISEVMEYDIKKNRQKVISLLLEENHDEAKSLTRDIEWYKTQKKFYYYEMKYCLQKAEKIQNVVSDKISIIEKLVEGEIKIEDYHFFSSTSEFKIIRKDGETEAVKVTLA